MKKKISVLFLMGLGLMSCGTKEDKGEVAKTDENSKKILTVWAWDKNFNVPIMEKAAKIYSEKNPNVEIKVVDNGRDDIEQKIHTSLSANAINTLPDIVLIEDYAAQKFLTSYPNSFMPLNDYINYNEFAKYKIPPMTVDNKTYGIPFDSGVTGLFYRRDYLKEAGISEERLQNITWKELIEIGKEVKAKTGKQLMADMALQDPGIVRVMMQSAGAWYFNEKGEIDFIKNEALKDAILTVKELFNSGVVNQASGWGEWVSNFTSGDMATISTGAWIIGSIKTEKSQSGKWGVAPIPRLDDIKSVNASNLGGSSWYILNKDNKVTAAEFMKAIFAENKEFYDEILTERGAIGTYLPSQGTPSYEAPDAFFDNQKVYQDFSKWMKEIPSVNYGVYVREADQAIVGVLKYIVEDKMSVDEGLEKAEAQLKSQIQ